jgi:CheY-like chemotaxis protein
VAAKNDGNGNVTKVLYVEHNDENLFMLKTRPELRGGFKVLAAEDSEKGCRLAATEHPDVMLMGLEMPVVDRWEPVRPPPSRTVRKPVTFRSSASPRMRRTASASRPLRRTATSSMPSRSSSSLWSPPFDVLSRTRNNHPLC